MLRLLIILISLFLPLSSFAAVLYLEPSTGQYPLNQTFIVKVKIDTEGECINTVEAALEYDKELLRASEFSQRESIITLWLQSPTIQENRIYFSGGIPGGYCGRILGDPGESDVLGEIVFIVSSEVLEGDTTEVEFLEKNCQVLLNDGLGSKAELALKGAQFEISEKAPLSADQWKKELLEDNILPEPFEILILKDPQIYQGKYFVIFQTSDKQTGIDYYQVKEGKGEWQKAESPYLLENQKLNSIIKVKAIDKASNERIVQYVPPTKPRPLVDWLIISLVAVLTVVIWLKVQKHGSKIY